MKQFLCLAGIVTAALAWSGCNKDFLQRTPQTSITEDNFFNTSQDLQTYTNGLYTQLQYGFDDTGSDNISNYSGGAEVDQVMRGTLSSANAGGWSDWSQLRSINYLLDHAGKVHDDTAAVNHYIGIARFFRAWYYFGKVKRYSNVPWYSHASSPDDSSLYKPEDPRSLVMDSVLSDLQYAALHIKPDQGDGTRVSQWSALALMARICLFEGTFRKYHAEVNLHDGQRFLDAALWACQQIMSSGRFAITGSGAEGYRALFTSTKLNGNKEIIQWHNCDPALAVGNNSHIVLGYTWSLSRSLEETYLMKDGTRFTDIPGYSKKVYNDIFSNRDPRLAETIAYPGYLPNGAGTAPYILKPSMGGYDQLKFYPRDPALRQGWNLDFTSLPVFRYAEILLVAAEAKAESGTLTQADLDQTVNLLRDRVQMPHLLTGATIDPVLAAQYPNATGADLGTLLEIRRERRVELACEGLRFDDITRWYAGQRLADAGTGMYIPALGALDVTGDGVPDIAILASPADESPIASLPDNIKNNLAKYYLKDATGKDNNFYLTNGNSGYIAFIVDRDIPKTFTEPQYYYRPIPVTQLVLNPALQQPYGWK